MHTTLERSGGGRSLVGYLRMRLVQFLSTIHTTPHVIYLTRHGQSEYNLLGKIGGNPSPTPNPHPNPTPSPTLA